MSRIYNQDTPDLSDLVFRSTNIKAYNYFCNSQKCTGYDHNAKRVLKFENVRLRYDVDCPDCGSVMFCKKAKNYEQQD